MSIAGLLIRFLIFYIIAIVLLGLTFYFFEFEPKPIIGLAILFAISAALANSFANKNGRYFTKVERRSAIFGITSICMIFQWLFISMSGKLVELKSGVLILAFTVALLITALVVGVAFEVVGKSLIKRGIIDETASGYNRKGIQLVKNSFFNSVLKLLLLTIILIIITIISIPIVGYFAT